MATVFNEDPGTPGNQEIRSSRRDRRPAHQEPTTDQIAAEASAIYPDTFDTPPTPDEIAAEAYAIYIARGGEHGRDEEDWLEAERRLRERRREP